MSRARADPSFVILPFYTPCFRRVARRLGDDQTRPGELAAGESYAAVSIRMRERRDLAIAHLHDAHGLPAVFASQPYGTSESTGEGQTRSADAGPGSNGGAHGAG